MAWDRRAWSEARPDKVVPKDGAALRRRWVEELHGLGFTPPPHDRTVSTHTSLGTPIGRVHRDALVDLALTRLGARRSSWNAADIRGEIERIITSVDIVATTAVRRELAEDLTARAVHRCEPLSDRDDVPDHVRSLTSRHVLAVEADLVTRLVSRAGNPTNAGQSSARLTARSDARPAANAMPDTAACVATQPSAKSTWIGAIHPQPSLYALMVRPLRTGPPTQPEA